MRLALHDFGGYPFSAQLARELAGRGHEVAYLFAAGFRSPRASVVPRTDDPSALSIQPVVIEAPYHAAAGLRRLAQERRYGRELAAAITEMHPTAVLSANCPLDAQAMAIHAAHEVGAGFGFWLQDIYSVALNKLLRPKLGLAGALIAARYGRLERTLLQRSDAVVPIAPEFMPVLERWGVSTDRITVIENWAPLEAAVPSERQQDWSERLRIGSRPTFLYAGTLGRKHDPALLIALARGIPEAEVVVVAEGVGADKLHGDAAIPSNLRLLPLQPAEDLSAMLASGDVLVALLSSDADAFSVPSKVLSYLAAGRPILAAMPSDNRAAKIIAEAGAGLVVEPKEESIVRAGRAMLGDAPAMNRFREGARAYAETAFDAEAKADAFERVLTAIAHPNDSRGEHLADTAITHT